MGQIYYFVPLASTRERDWAAAASGVARTLAMSNPPLPQNNPSSIGQGGQWSDGATACLPAALDGHSAAIILMGGEWISNRAGKCFHV